MSPFKIDSVSTRCTLFAHISVLWPLFFLTLSHTCCHACSLLLLVSTITRDGSPSPTDGALLCAPIWNLTSWHRRTWHCADKPPNLSLHLRFADNSVIAPISACHAIRINVENPQSYCAALDCEDWQCDSAAFNGEKGTHCFTNCLCI